MPDQDRSNNSRPQIFLDRKDEPSFKEDPWIQAFIVRFLELLRSIGGKRKE